MGKLVTGAELGQIFGVSAVTINTWRKDGMPVHEERPAPLGRSYDTEKVIAWFSQKGNGKANVQGAGERRQDLGRIDKERADHLALKNAMLRREYIPITVVTVAVSRVAQKLAGALDTLPVDIKRIAPELQPNDIEEIRRQVVEIQNTAADYAPELRRALDEAFAGTRGLASDDDA